MPPSREYVNRYAPRDPPCPRCRAVEVPAVAFPSWQIAKLLAGEEETMCPGCGRYRFPCEMTPTPEEPAGG